MRGGPRGIVAQLDDCMLCYAMLCHAEVHVPCSELACLTGLRAGIANPEFGVDIMCICIYMGKKIDG